MLVPKRQVYLFTCPPPTHNGEIQSPSVEDGKQCEVPLCNALSLHGAIPFFSVSTALQKINFIEKIFPCKRNFPTLTSTTPLYSDWPSVH